MKTVIASIVLSFSIFAANAAGPVGPIKEYFTHDSSLRPYVQWIAKNTRFTDADRITIDEVPPIEMLNSEEYRKKLDGNSLAAYHWDSTTIFINTDKFEGRPDVVIHELIHFYQHRHSKRTGIVMTVDEQEKEATRIQQFFVLGR